MLLIVLPAKRCTLIDWLDNLRITRRVNTFLALAVEW